KLDAGKVALERRAFDFPELLSGLLRTFAEQARAKGLTLTGDLAANLPPRLIGDPLRLSQILVNLLSNAVKFTETGGVILGAGVAGEIDGRVRLAFRVTDTGIGIAPDKRGQIFELFSQAETDTTRHHGGTGLGLTIVQRLVALMDGAIVVDSEP